MIKNWFVELKNKTGIKVFTVLTFFTGFPSILKACAVCFSGTEETFGSILSHHTYIDYSSNSHDSRCCFMAL